MTYVKLFGSILDSTVWNEPGSTRLVWITMLAMADQHGCIWASVPGLAKRAGVERAECERALECFMTPDPDSRTKDFEGRRIEEIDGGWALLNHAKFRELLSAEDQKAKAAERQRRFKAKSKPETTDSNGNAFGNAEALPVTVGNAQSQKVTPVTTSEQIRTDQIRTEAKKSARGLGLFREQAVELLDDLNAARKRVKPGSHGYGPQDANLKHIAARLEAGYSADDVRHVIAVRETEARQKPESWQWFDAVTPFREDNFVRALGGDPKQRVVGKGEPARAEPLPFDQVFGQFRDQLT